MEGDGGTGIRGRSYHLHVRNGLALGVLLHKHLALAVDFRDEEVTEGVHAGYAHAVQTAGHLVAVLIELTAGVEDGENHLQGAAVLLLVHARRDASTIILDTDGIVFQDLYIYFRAETGHRLVYTVVHHLVYQVVKAPFSNVSDVHGRALSNGLQAFQDLDATGGILLFGRTGLFVLYHLYLAYNPKKCTPGTRARTKRTKIGKICEKIKSTAAASRRRFRRRRPRHRRGFSGWSD